MCVSPGGRISGYLRGRLRQESCELPGGWASAPAAAAVATPRAARTPRSSPSDLATIPASGLLSYDEALLGNGRSPSRANRALPSPTLDLAFDSLGGLLTASSS